MLDIHSTSQFHTEDEGIMYQSKHRQQCPLPSDAKTQELKSLKSVKVRWEDNIKMDLGETGWGGMDWIDVAEDTDQWRAFVNTVMNLRVP
jgi:hypothetical protein